jgi:hypothetical protein
VPDGVAQTLDQVRVDANTDWDSCQETASSGKNTLWPEPAPYGRVWGGNCRRAPGEFLPPQRYFTVLAKANGQILYVHATILRGDRLPFQQPANFQHRPAHPLPEISSRDAFRWN